LLFIIYFFCSDVMLGLKLSIPWIIISGLLVYLLRDKK